MPPTNRIILCVALTAMLGITPARATDGHTCGGLTATIVGTDGDDLIKGTAGADVIVALAGDDVIRSYDGNDVVCGGAGDDVLNGGSGDDSLDGGDGADTAAYGGAPQAVRVDLAAGTASGGHGVDRLEGIENATGSIYDDELIGDDGANILNGRMGSDTLDGRAGADRLRGGPGVDTARYEGAPGAVAVDLRAGRATGGHGDDALVWIEAVLGSDFDDYLAGSGADNLLDGGGGDDVVLGGPGADHLTGGEGIDVVFGGIGIDSCSGETTRACEPADPGDAKNCSDFLTQPHAQAWHDAYVRYFGDVAHLDADGNGAACEGLPG